MGIIDKLKEALLTRGVPENVVEQSPEADGWIVTLPEHPDVDIPVCIDRSWLDQIDISHLYPSWESIFGPKYVQVHLPELMSGKLLQGEVAWVLFNIGLHFASVINRPLPKTVRVRNDYVLEPRCFFKPLRSESGAQQENKTGCLSTVKYYFFLLNDYTVFGYRPMDDASFNMPSNVIAMLEYTYSQSSTNPTLNKFDVAYHGAYELGPYYEAYAAARPKLEPIDDIDGNTDD